MKFTVVKGTNLQEVIDKFGSLLPKAHIVRFFNLYEMGDVSKFTFAVDICSDCLVSLITGTKEEKRCL